MYIVTTPVTNFIYYLHWLPHWHMFFFTKKRKIWPSTNEKYIFAV